MEDKTISVLLQLSISDLLNVADDEAICRRADEIRAEAMKDVTAEIEYLTRPVKVGFTNGPNGPDFIAQ